MNVCLFVCFVCLCRSFLFVCVCVCVRAYFCLCVNLMEVARNFNRFHINCRTTIILNAAMCEELAQRVFFVCKHVCTHNISTRDDSRNVLNVCTRTHMCVYYKHKHKHTYLVHGCCLRMRCVCVCVCAYVLSDVFCYDRFWMVCTCMHMYRAKTIEICTHNAHSNQLEFMHSSYLCIRTTTTTISYILARTHAYTNYQIMIIFDSLYAPIARPHSHKCV